MYVPVLAGSAVTSVLSVGSLMVTVTVAVGCVSSSTVYVPVLPSLTGSVVGETVARRVVVRYRNRQVDITHRVVVRAVGSCVKTGVCSVDQFEVEKLRLAGSAVSVLSVGSLMVTVTVAVGCVSSSTVYVPVLPSLTGSVNVRLDDDTVTSVLFEVMAP